MRIKSIIYYLIFITIQYGFSGYSFTSENQIVLATKRVHVPNYLGAYNPSIIRHNGKILLTFRYLPCRAFQPWLSYIGIIELNDVFEPISYAQLLDTRPNNKSIPSQSEDARIFACGEKLYIVYNDNLDLTFPSERRDMHIAEVLSNGNSYYLGAPIKLVHENKYSNVFWQKNWSPFVWNENIFLSYSINPHEVLCPNLANGTCQVCYESQKSIFWNLGALRGGSPALLVNGEYLAFFHSGVITASPASDNQELWHYFMGAYTFSAEPPFQLTSVSAFPLESPEFYTYSSYEKRVVYPGGFIVDGSYLYLAYGKDDSEIWIAKIDLDALKKSMNILR